MFKQLFKLIPIAVTMGLVNITAANAADLTVYTAVEAEDLARYAEEFNKSHPDININWVRDSTGIITAKLLAEKDNPQADVIWGLAATSLLLMKSEDMLEAYAPKGVEQLDPKLIKVVLQLGRVWMLGLPRFATTQLKRVKLG